MQKLRSMKISKQLILTFGITVIMFLSIIVTALYLSLIHISEPTRPY